MRQIKRIDCRAYFSGSFIDIAAADVYSSVDCFGTTPGNFPRLVQRIAKVSERFRHRSRPCAPHGRTRFPSQKTPCFQTLFRKRMNELGTRARQPNASIDAGKRDIGRARVEVDKEAAVKNEYADYMKRNEFRDM
ncbi:hypothetical protein X962_4056 [Burkholderia pseudomallei MSHR7343]|nr:hypothetical protein X962_4056 [Burkholderia pseudomallei MSHR7343]